MKTLNAFFEKVKADENLQKKVAEFGENKDQDGMMIFMKEKGVSDEDIEKAFQSLNASTSQLCDEELDAVTGGDDIPWYMKPNFDP